MEDEKEDNIQTETVPVSQETKEKKKRKFTWTPKRRAAFEKCVAARRKKAPVKPIVEQKVKHPSKKLTHQASSSSDNESNHSEDESESEIEIVKKPKKTGSKKYKKQFHKLTKEIKDIKKSIQHKKNPIKYIEESEDEQEDESESDDEYSSARNYAAPKSRYFFV